MTAAVYQANITPPGLYRLARALRRLSVITLIILILFTASVVYSAVLTVRSGSGVGPFSETFASNGTIVLSGSLTLNNNGFYSVQGLTLAVRVTNTTGSFVGATEFGPTTLGSSSSIVEPLTLYVPVSGAGPGPSLLTDDQSLPVAVWANATFGYLFPVSLAVSAVRSWGAPFADLSISLGTPTPNGTGANVPVTLSFENHSPVTDAGNLNFVVLSSGGVRCGASGFTLEVGPGAPFTQTTTVALAGGCSPAGGTVQASYVTPAFTVTLPPEAIP
ncbi:MAG TPA: hypothetical protein VMI55_06165 [Thermoplasmata archaeon]|nr:hypothetical protein [Thermoplasmata archaeon]